MTSGDPFELCNEKLLAAFEHINIKHQHKKPESKAAKKAFLTSFHDLRKYDVPSLIHSYHANTRDRYRDKHSYWLNKDHVIFVHLNGDYDKFLEICGFKKNIRDLPTFVDLDDRKFWYFLADKELLKSLN